MLLSPRIINPTIRHRQNTWPGGWESAKGMPHWIEHWDQKASTGPWTLLSLSSWIPIENMYQLDLYWPEPELDRNK